MKKLRLFGGIMICVLSGCATPLYQAIYNNNVPQVQRLLDSGTERDKGTYNILLAISAARGELNVAELLIDHGADPNGPSSYMGNPLEWAVRRNYPTIVKLLLDRGANPNSNAYFSELTWSFSGSVLTLAIN
jgi:ankyrin repeat protein